jgi:hypothetical protein
VNQAYDLAQPKTAGDKAFVGARAARHNKRMQLTKGGWRRGAASSSAVLRPAAIVNRLRRARPSQLIRGVRRT